jgi:hypothetical protein
LKSINAFIISSQRRLNKPNFLLRQAVQLIDHLIDLPVNSVDLALKGGLLVFGFGCGQSL